MRVRFIAFCAAVLLAPACMAQIAPPSGAGTTPTPRPVALQTRDAGRAIPAPSAADQQLSAKVQQALQRNDSLSPAARRVKVIASDGAVVLRGPVADDKEKAKVDAVVRSVAGVREVTNELDVAKQ